MRIDFERSGGFAGMVTSKVVDSTTLSSDQANQLRQLVDAADFFRLPPTITTRAVQPDRFQYRLTVEDNGKQHTVEVGEQAVPGTLRPLLDWITTAARQG
jgi:hypothetical protein